MIHSTELISEVFIADYGSPNSDTMSPAIPMNGNIRVILAWCISRQIYGPSEILLLIDLNCQIYHLVI
jgi:hypothetical protein